MAKTTVVEYKDEEYDVTLTVRRASALDGIDRSIRVAQIYGPRRKKGEPEEVRSTRDQLRRILLLQGYPACLAVTSIESRGKKTLSVELLPEEFLQLPDELVFHWEIAVFDLNPHWVVKAPDDEDDEEGEATEPDDASVSTKD